MPIEVGIWRVEEKPIRVNMSSPESEAKLENLLVEDISILSPNLMLIGSQVLTSYGKYIDLLAMDGTGNLSVIELKKNRTPREVVAQLLDYGSWIQDLSHEDITNIYTEKNPGRAFEEGFYEVFNTNPPEKLNQRHELIVVASELDPSTERIIAYLTDNYGVPVNAVFFRYFRDEDREYLARTWLIDPDEVEVKIGKSPQQKSSEPWNGRDFYAAIGEGEHRTWADCCRYGFISGGQGRWYSQTLNLLFPGARIFVNFPGAGYVGVGIVKETAVPIKEFIVTIDGQERPILEAPVTAPKMGENADNLDLCEYLVRVEWIKTVPRDQAYWERGMFAIQHTVCRLRNRFTIEHLAKHFEIED